MVTCTLLHGPATISFFEGLPKDVEEISACSLQSLALQPGESPFRVLATVEAIAEVYSPGRWLVRELLSCTKKRHDVAPCLVKTLAVRTSASVLLSQLPEEELCLCRHESQPRLEDFNRGRSLLNRKSALAKELL